MLIWLPRRLRSLYSSGTRVVTALIAVVCIHLGQAQIVPVSSLGRSLPAEHLGETLIGELNCVACHSAGDVTRGRLNSKHAPHLGAQGVPLTPQFIRDYLNDPHSEGLGRTMPDMLHGLSGSEKESVIESLVHYLMSMQSDEHGVKTGLDEFKLENGRQLFHSVGCVTCHSPQETPAELEVAAIKAPSFPFAGVGDRFAGDSIPLGDLSRKTSVAALADFLENPLASRPSGRMPSLGLSTSEAKSIAMYIARGQATGLFDPSKPLEKTAGLKYTYIEFGGEEHLAEGNEDFVDHFPGSLPGRARQFLKVAGSGIADDVSHRFLKRPEQAGLLFHGSISIDVAGEYTFYTKSDDGSRLYVGTKLVVDNGGDHSPLERSGSVKLSIGDHPFKVTFYNGGGGGELTALFKGPGISKQIIPSDRFSYLGQNMVPLGGENFAANADKARVGREHFRNYGCVQCHDTGDSMDAKSSFAPALSSLGARSDSGCLSLEPSNRASKYFLRQSERLAIKKVLDDAQTLAVARSGAEEISQTLNQLNCYACHERNGHGGPSVARASYFGTTTEVDLGDEGRMPPHLNLVGAKLRSEWTKKVLVGEGAVRPYMATRMPQFGEANVGHLPDLFHRIDDPSPDDPSTAVSLMDSKYGRRLLGTKGMACITCHTYGPFPSLGVPAIDLTQMSHRLKRSWFRDYLIHPASLRPGTRMPSFFPEGKSVNEEIFEGDSERQIQALWGFLEIADASNPPDGLVQGVKEILATEEAVIYRNFIEGSGARSIAVGYPEKGNLSFDAATTRLAMIWHGPFIDGARHSSGRGQGFEPPLGHNRLSLPDGPPLAFLPDQNVPWPETVGKTGGFEFKGYRLDKRRRPTFMYRFRNIDVEDYPTAVGTELDAKFRRSIRFKSKSDMANVWMKVAEGDSIDQRGVGLYVVDGRLQLTIKGPGAATRPLVRSVDGIAELLVPVDFVKGEAVIEMELVW
jgi:mono/diheme cytochrome c family protein